MSHLTERTAAHKVLGKLLKQATDHSTNPLTLNGALTLQERAAEAMIKCEAAQAKCIATCKDEEGIDLQINAFDPIEATYQKLSTLVKDIIKGLTPAPSTRSSTRSNVNVHLPPIDLPTFDGNFANWPSFRDLYLATVDNHTGLAPSQKLKYLKSSLQGPPADLIRALPFTDAHYQEAWTMLKDRYDNEREIIYSLINKLLYPVSVQSENANDLQRLIDNATESLSSLKVLKQPVDNWDSILVVTYTHKLDPATRREWAIRQTGTTLPTFKEFSSFVTTHIRGLLATGTQDNPASKKKERQISSHHSSSGTTSVSTTCTICKGSHYNYQCSDLTSKNPKERNQLVKRHQLCFNCLRKDHRIQQCKSKSVCKVCHKRHHTLLHVEAASAQPTASLPTQREDATAPTGEQVSTSRQVVLGSHHASYETQVLLSTAIVNVKTRSGGLQPCRIFLDSGSQGTFITEDCVRRLGLPRDHSRITITGVSSTTVGTTRGRVTLSLNSRDKLTDTLTVDAHILPKITGYLPKFKCEKIDWDHLRGIFLADPQHHVPAAVDMLLGADYFAMVLRTGRITGPANSPIAQETMFGWVLSGRVAVSDQPTMSMFHTEMEMDHLIRRFWELEEPPKVQCLTKEEKQCENHFTSTYKRDLNGRFHVAVPFNNKKKDLGASRAAAVQRLLQVERRLGRNPHHKEKYIEFIREYESLGHMVRVSPHEAAEVIGATNYLPHHFVVNEGSSTTKLRVVFDGSAKTTSGVSFNDTMLVGATVQDDLYALILRFRTHPIVLKADITKMFRQFQLQAEDANFHRIVWRESPQHQIEDFKLLTVTYGTACAPFLATRCIQQLGRDCTADYPAASTALQNDMYVDDLMGGAITPAEAIDLYNQLTKVAEGAGLEFRKWASNDLSVLQAIPEDQRDMDPHTFDETPSIKALGVRWNPVSDTFNFIYVEPTECSILTKRILLSDLARVFDPLGLLGAVTVRAKLLLQELWKLSIGWDDPIPVEVQEQWYEYQEDLKIVPEVKFPRLIIPPSSAKYQLHGFCDASERAYGTVIYLRAVHDDGSVTVNFLTSKTRVAPLRQVTLPRLELTGAVLLAELITYVHDCLKLSCELFLWCDSTITLRWIASQPRRWRTFVANRVANIQELTPVECWRHVPGVDNPADLASRGVSARELLHNQFWMTGPAWLSEPQLPVFAAPTVPTDTNMEERALPVLAHHIDVDLSILTRFSSFPRMKRVVAYILRFAANCRLPATSRNLGHLTGAELHRSLTCIVKVSQHHDYPRELINLKKNVEVPVSSKLATLHPCLDNEGIIRVGGRLQHAPLPEAQKHQIILSGASHLSDLLTDYYHKQHLHSGFQLTWAAIQSRFWLIGGRDRVRHYCRKCVVCRRHRAQAAEQLMGNLPSPRVTPARPFLHTGVDFAGPFTLKNPVGRAPKTYKGYLCLFVCMVTKAIHLEPVSSLSTEAFLATLRRFVSRRGMVAHMYSDCGSNFIGADKELKAFVISRQTQQQLSEKMSVEGLQWHFNPPSAPHQGGLWEAGVKSAKHHLRRVLGNAILTYEQFNTILCQVEAVLNSRPLYPSSSDPHDFSALTPGHFLIGEPLTAVPDQDLKEVKTNRLSLFQLQQQRVQHFWRRWAAEYLNTLQQRNKWKWEQENVKVGDLVLIHEESSPGEWKMGRISQIHPDQEGRVRNATVKTANTELHRPIVKLIPLLESD